MLRTAALRSARQARRPGLARRHQSALAEGAKEEAAKLAESAKNAKLPDWWYSLFDDRRLANYTAAVGGVLLLQQLGSSLFGGGGGAGHHEAAHGHGHHKEAEPHGGGHHHEEPAPAAAEPAPAPPPPVAAAPTVPSPSAGSRPARMIARSDTIIMPTGGLPPPLAAAAPAPAAPTPAPEPVPAAPAPKVELPPIVGETVVEGAFVGASDGTNAWVIERDAAGAAVSAKQLTFRPAGSAPPSVKGFLGDGSWLLVTHSAAEGEAEHLWALPSSGGAGGAIDMTPFPKASVGAVVAGAPLHNLRRTRDEALVEVSGLTPGGAAHMYRATLPAAVLPPKQRPSPLAAAADGGASSAAKPSLALDTEVPVGTRGVSRWMVDDEGLAVRAALVLQNDGKTALLVRDETALRMGGDAWLATCKRLGLPEPPLDPDAPRAFTQWKVAAEWPDGAPQPTGLGFRDGCAWVYSAGEVVAYNTAGAGELKLFL